MNTTPEQIQEIIREQVTKNRIVLYMKGTPEFPQCGFSKDVVDVLNHLAVKYISVNVLENTAVREGVKIYGRWPTIPQLYVDGELIGGCDIVLEQYRNGALLKLIGVS